MNSFCPFKMARGLMDWECEEEDCALWNTYFGMCSLAVDAHLKAETTEQRRQAQTEAGRQEVVQ